MTIGQKLVAGFGVALVFPVIIGVIAYRSTANLLESRKPITHTYQVLGELDSLLAALIDCETGQRGYLLTGHDDYLEPYRKGLAAVDQALAHVTSLTADNPRQEARLRALTPLIATRLDLIKETIQLRKDRGFEAAVDVVRSDRGNKTQDAIRAIVQEMKAEEQDLLGQRDADAQRQAQSTFTSILSGTGLAFLLLSAIAFFTSRSITVPIRQAVSSLTALGAEILAATTQQSSGAAESAAAVSQTVTPVG